MEKRSIILIIMIMIAIVGLVSSLLSYNIYKSGEGYCPGTHSKNTLPSPSIPVEHENLSSLPIITANDNISNCKYLYSRPEAVVVGIHFSELAPIYFISILIILVSYFFTYHYGLRILLGILYLVGLLTIPYLIYVEAKFGVICLYCTIMHVVIVSSSLLYYYEYRFHRS